LIKAALEPELPDSPVVEPLLEDEFEDPQAARSIPAAIHAIKAVMTFRFVRINLS
jgi:hypothetical protein